MTSTSGRNRTAVTQFANGWSALGVFVISLAYSLICRPLPSVNEPYYLTKAKHYWQPMWCSGDFFLDSSNPHLVFYQTIGLLTKWLSLPQAALAGRIIVLALLAWGWTRLISRLSPHRWAPVGIACFFLLLQSLGNFSGEWVVGGVESKVVAYGLAFWGWGALIDRRFLVTGICLGMAVSFHPVVGGWCVIATVLAAGFRAIQSKVAKTTAVESLADVEVPSASHAAENIVTASGSMFSNSQRNILAVLLFVIATLPGGIPAVQILINNDSAASATADRYSVGTRLAHHLDPMAFPVAAYRYYGLLLLVWALLRSKVPTSSQRRWFEILVGASVVIAVVGFLVGLGPRPISEMPLVNLRVWLLKFYPFRLADILVPMLVAMTVFDTVAVWAFETTQRAWRRWIPVTLGVVSLGLALAVPNLDKNSSRMSAAQQTDWREACDWIRETTPPDSLLYAANESWAVKWFCHRPEYVNYKDCPQDAAGILEWARRLTTLKQWHQDSYRDDGRITLTELDSLHDQTSITHLIVSRLGPIETEPVYQNGTYRVYQLGP